MSPRKKFLREKDNYAFLQKMAGENKSAHINQMLQNEKRQALKVASCGENMI